MSPSKNTPIAPASPPPRNQGGPTLVIAYGNTLRKDDGVARKVADELEALALPQMQVISCDLLLPELAEPVASASQVIFVDAETNSTTPVRARRIFAAESSQLMAHHASPSIILALARDVFGRVPQAWLVTIPGQDFGIGEGLSEVAAQGGIRALELIREIQLRADCGVER